MPLGHYLQLAEAKNTSDTPEAYYIQSMHPFSLPVQHWS